MRNAARWFPSLLAPGFLLCLAAGPLAAQSCRGMEVGPRGWAVQALVGVTDHDGRRLGARFTREWSSGVAVTPELGRTTFEADGPDIQDVGAVVSMEVAPLLGELLVSLPPELSLCPLAGVRLSEMEDLDVSATHLGLSAGWAVSPGQGEWTLHSFLTPLAVWRMATVEGMTDTSWNGGLRGGVGARWRWFLATVELERIWTAAREDRATVGVGVVF